MEKIKIKCPNCGKDWPECGCGEDYMKYGKDDEEIGDGE